MSVTLEPSDWGSVLAGGLALVAGLAAIPVLPGEFAVYFAPDGTPNTVVPAVFGVFIMPVVASAMFLYLRTGVLVADKESRASARAALLVVAGTASLQGSLLLLNLEVLSNPLLAVTPGIVLILFGGALRR